MQLVIVVRSGTALENMTLLFLTPFPVQFHTM